jgi:hypothetical protein
VVHSGDTIFRYDTNVRFVTHHLRPGVERQRDAVAAAHGEEWQGLTLVLISTQLELFCPLHDPA